MNNYMIFMLFATFMADDAQALDAKGQCGNGRRVADGASHPWLLTLCNINRETEETSLCGANLIRVPYLEGGSDIAVTAAHCLGNGSRRCHQHEESIFEQYKVVVVGGNHRLRDGDSLNGEIIAEVVDAVCSGQGDIAVIRFIPPFMFKDTVQPIPLPKSGEIVKDGTKCVLAGWGSTKSMTKGNILDYWDSPIELHVVDVQIDADSQCSSIYYFYSAECESMICSLVTPSADHPWPGDSGSALVCPKSEDGRGVFHGVASELILVNMGEPELHSVIFTEVSYFADWIDEAIDRLLLKKIYDNLKHTEYR